MINKARTTNSRNMLLTPRRSTSSTASSTSSTNNATMASKRPMRQKIMASFKKNDESSIASDTSSLGSKMQMPHAFLLNKKFSSKPAQIFPTSARSSSSSREILRQEAKVQRLVLQAKKTQEASVMRQMQDPCVARSMSVKLPAASYRQTKRSRMGGLLPLPFLKQEAKQEVDSSALQNPSNGFRGKPGISSATNSFVREEQRRNRAILLDATNKNTKSNQVSSRPRSHLVVLPEEDENNSQGAKSRGWKTYLRLPHFSPRASK
jgi:hypothetical protein